MGKKKDHQFKTDLTKQYIIELLTVDESMTVPVICNVEAERDFIRATAAEMPEMFQVHRFYDDFFQWLIYRGKIILYDNDVENNNEP